MLSGQTRGVIHRVCPSDTAFSFRDANVAEVIVGVDPANNERMIGWARGYRMALHPYSAGGSYVNMMIFSYASAVKHIIFFCERSPERLMQPCM